MFRTSGKQSFNASISYPAIIAVSVAGLLSIASLGTREAFADSDDPPARVARLGHIQGAVSIEPSGVDQWSEATSNYPVATGDRVYADQDGRGEISAGDVVARVWHGTDVTMTSLTDQIAQFGLAQGTLRVHTFAVDQDDQVEIDTPNGAVTVIQPGDIRIDVLNGDPGSGNDGTIVTVNSGAVQLSGPNLQQDVTGGQSVLLQGSNPIQVSQYNIPAADEFDSWSLDRDRHMRDSQTARYVNRDAVGSDDLDDYGSWQQTPDYGPVWYPQQVAAEWAPYREGHWVWTGPWGWTWVDDEPWGYAPFHYGRWVQVDGRWGWMPGPVSVRPIWSPALVAFVGGGGFSVGVGVSAWFPLGPGEPYHPWYHCSPVYQQRVNVTNVNITVIHNTTIINNYNGYLRNPQDNSRLASVRYANRDAAVTAMRQTDFASARSARSAMVRVDPAELRNAQIVAHPPVQPTTQSFAPRPARAVPVPVRRPTLLTEGGRETQATPGARPQAVPYRPGAANPGNTGNRMNDRPVSRGAAPQTGAQRNTYPAEVPSQQPGHVQPSPVPSNNPGTQQDSASNGYRRPAPGQPVPPKPQPPEQRGGQQPYPQRPQPIQTAPQQQRPLINRNEAPPSRPTFEQQQPALNEHPGRPLEPQQLNNLNQGRPAGPARDAEYPPHPQSDARRPQQSRPAPPPKPAPREKDYEPR